MGIPSCPGPAACPVRIHANATSVNTPEKYPSERAPIPLIVLLTPWLAHRRSRDPKVLRAATFPVIESVRVLLERVTLRPRRQRSPRKKPAKIGRKSPSVGWFAGNFT